jgi:putative hemolysin
VEEQHSRVPIYDPQHGPENIIGVLYAKELMRWLHLNLRGRVAGPRDIRVRDVMRTVLVVPESKSVSDLLVDFKQHRRHMAVVVDEFGSTSGLVTVEDALEQLVGEIEDEFDIAAQRPLAAVGGVMVLDGATNIRDLETQHQIELPREAGFETLAGFVLSRLQRLPKGGESFEFENRRFSVAGVEGHRVTKVKIEALPQQQRSVEAQAS